MYGTRYINEFDNDRTERDIGRKGRNSSFKDLNH